MTEIGPDVVDLIVERVTERLTAHFDSKHDGLAQRMAVLEKLIEVSANDIKHDTRFTRLIASRSLTNLIGSLPPPETPNDDTPCPPDFDRAATADPDDGDQRVDLDHYGTVAILRPGVDPQDAWDEVKTALREERGQQ